mmetsp:Transcript_65916/g.157619  ORF Transcript_65916/g.157619 Transcript_65916/m.157619 type:complete len:420 (-) Transcript_65916:49-1308(-)
MLPGRGHGRLEAKEMFLFVNPGSGGGVGKFFLEDGMPKSIPMADGSMKTLRVFSLPDGKPGDKPGFHALKQATAAGLVRVIVGGGDGSVMWVAGEAEKHGVDVATQMALGIIPLGTGNDFSRHLGWGGTNPRPKSLRRNNYRRVVQLMQRFAVGLPEPFDVWKITIESDPIVGRVCTHNKQGGEDIQLGGKIDRLMILYYSVGDDGMSGYAFEPKRMESQFGNLFQYGMAVASTYFAEKCSGDSLEDKIKSVHAGDSPTAPVAFHTTEELQGPELTHNPGILLFLNVDSYAGGQAHLWRNSSPALGVDAPLDADLLDREASAYDDKLEVLSSRSLARIGASRLPLVGARRIMQTNSAYIEFHRPEPGEDLEEFFQIDGEFYRVINPKSCQVRHKQKLQVLHNSSAEPPDMGGDSDFSDA